MSNPSKPSASTPKGDKAAPGIPVAALKRFANDLEAEIPANKFLQVNRERVSEFINKKPEQEKKVASKPRVSRTYQVPGICDYTSQNAAAPASLIHLQSLPEFHPSLGARSRFGEGDGSFFDQWLNSDISKTKHLFDKNGFPLMRFGGQTHGGFKKHIQDFKNGEDKGSQPVAYVQTYAERKAERLRREKEEAEAKQKEQEAGTDDKSTIAFPPLTRFNTGVSALTDVSYTDDFVRLELPAIGRKSVKPLTLASLTTQERESYFGDNARAAFFESYRQLARMRNTIGLGDEDLEIEALLTARTQQMDQFEDHDELAELIDLSMEGDYLSDHSSENTLEMGDVVDEHNNVKAFSRHQSRRAMIMEDGNEVLPTSPSSRQSTVSGLPLYLEDDASKPSTAQSIRSTQSSPHRRRTPSRGNPRTAKPRTLYSRQRLDDTQATEEEKARLFAHLGKQSTSDAPQGVRPLSARSRFLVGCVRKGILPQASLIIRRGAATTLSIASFGIGNDLALLLAASLSTLPLLEGLNISDNNLTDVGLVPIVKALTNCVHLQSFDVSRNKVDAETAQALLNYISTPACVLTHLIMGNANVDDAEAARFVKVIASRRNFKELDLSQNELGSHEFALKAHETAGMALGSLLSDPRCTMETLKLSWNMIRFKSGIELVRSLKLNTSLTYLDLSYNRLCAEGGDALGNALHSNRTLRVLKLAHNNITSRPCCTILSGVVSCESLTDVDLSKNPIGELGARLLLSIDLKYGDRVKVDIRNCQLRVRDNTCWFDPTKPKKEYTLHLNDPYERCVCIELLRLVANPADGHSIETYQYKGPEDSDLRDIALEVFNASAAAVPSDGYESPREAEAKIEALRNTYKDTANRIFRQYDTDGSGGLDRAELAMILDQMGMEGSNMMVNQLMSIYDTDGSGLVEEDEFIAFLMDVKSSSMECVDLKASDRFVYLKDEFTGKGSPKPYLPPESGTVHIKIDMDTTKEVSPQHISRRSVETMLDATKSSEDRSAIFDYALTVMRLQFTDAQNFYRVMLKEIGSSHQVLTRLVPRMSTPNDARLLITYVTQHDFEQMHILRQALGPLYFIYIGLPNGYYRLNLAEEPDQACMKALLELSYNSAIYRKRAGLGNTSQDGNWLGFRNTVYEGKNLILTPEWLNNLPEKGRLEFDFININNVSMADLEISNFRLFRLMQGLGMVQDDKRRRIFDKLAFDKEEGRAASKGSGYRPHTEMKTSTMEQASAYLHKLYSGYATTRAAVVERPISDVERQFLVPTVTTPVKQSTAATTAVSTAQHTPNSSPKHAPRTTNVASAPPSVAPTPTAVQVRKDAEKDPHASGNEAVHNDSHGTFVKDMMESGLVDPSIVAERLLETLKFALAGRFLTAVQLALLVEKFPEGFLPCGEYATYRTELIIALYSRVVDLVNFDYVLRDLEASEVAILLFRLGWLNMWNPLKAEGRIVLDLSRREEKQVLRMLLMMNFAEPGQTWLEASYRQTRTDAADETWVLPATWYTEATLPSVGIVSLRYFSGMGCGQDDCSPNPTCRHTLMALVLAKSYSADVWSVNKANMESIDVMVNKMGCKLSFATEPPPKELAGHGAHHKK